MTIGNGPRWLNGLEAGVTPGQETRVVSGLPSGIRGFETQYWI